MGIIMIVIELVVADQGSQVKKCRATEKATME
jgi:hypothetical protein